MAAAISEFLINHQTEIASSPAYSGVLAKTGWDHPLLSLQTANFAKGLTTDSTDFTDCMVPRSSTCSGSGALSFGYRIIQPFEYPPFRLCEVLPTSMSGRPWQSPNSWRTDES